MIVLIRDSVFGSSFKYTSRTRRIKAKPAFGSQNRSITFSNPRITIDFFADCVNICFSTCLLYPLSLLHYEALRSFAEQLDQSVDYLRQIAEQTIYIPQSTTQFVSSLPHENDSEPDESTELLDIVMEGIELPHTSFSQEIAGQVYIGLGYCTYASIYQEPGSTTFSYEEKEGLLPDRTCSHRRSRQACH